MAFESADRGASARALQERDAAFDRAFGLVAFTLNQHLVDHWLHAARLLTEGDFGALVVWGVLAHQNVAHLMPPGSVPTSVLNERGRIPDGSSRVRPMLLRDIAAIAGIPRETVRRKLDKLAGFGFVQRQAEGWTVTASRTDEELREFTRESTWRLLAVADEIRRLLGDAARPAARSPDKLGALVG